MSKQSNPDLKKRIDNLEQRVKKLEWTEKAREKRKAKLLRDFSREIGQFNADELADYLELRARKSPGSSRKAIKNI